MQDAFDEGEFITREGAIGENFFIIHMGTVIFAESLNCVSMFYFKRTLI